MTTDVTINSVVYVISSSLIPGLIPHGPDPHSSSLSQSKLNNVRQGSFLHALTATGCLGGVSSMHLLLCGVLPVIGIVMLQEYFTYISMYELWILRATASGKEGRMAG